MKLNEQWKCFINNKEQRRIKKNVSVIWRATDRVKEIDGNSIQQVIPKEYTQLNYIQNISGSMSIQGGGAPANVGSYIDFGINPKAGSIVKMKFNTGSLEGGYCCLFGGYYSNTTNYGIVIRSSTTFLLYGSQAVVSGITWQDNTDYDLTFDTSTKKVTINNTVLNISTSLSGTSGNSLYIFTNNALGSLSGYDTTYTFKGKIKSFEYIEGTTTVLNAIPAKRNSDSVIGMYDTVSETFFTNKGIGEFVGDGKPEPSSDNPIKIKSVGDECNASEIPDEYDELDCIIANGSSALSVGGKCLDDETSGMKVTWETTYSFSALSGRQLFGYDGNSTSHYLGSNGTHPEMGVNNILSSVTLTTNTKYRFVAHYINSSTASSDNTRFEVYDSAGTLLGTKNNTSYLGTAKSQFGIFRIANYDSLYCASGTKFYGCKVWFDGELVGNIIPCRRKSDSKLGVYNTIDNTFWHQATNVINSSVIEFVGTAGNENKKYKINILNKDTSTEYSIVIDEPLRKVGDYADEINIARGTDDWITTLTRNVEVLDDTGEKTIEESYQQLVPPTTETVTWEEDIPTIKDGETLEVTTEVQPSKIELV